MIYKYFLPPLDLQFDGEAASLDGLVPASATMVEAADYASYPEKDLW